MAGLPDRLGAEEDDDSRDHLNYIKAHIPSPRPISGQSIRSFLSPKVTQRTPAQSRMAANYLSLLGSLLASDLANDEAQRRIQHLQAVLPVIMLMAKPLSPISIDDLLDLPFGTTAQILQPLHPVMTIPDNPYHPITTVDSSFKRFLLDPDLCTDPRFVIAEGAGQRHIAQVCLVRVNTLLRPNIGGIPEGKLKAEVYGLRERLDHSVSLGLRYSCLHFARHLSKAPSDRDLAGLLDHFSAHKLLEWLEILGLLDEIQVTIPAIASLKSWYLSLDHGDSLTSQLLQDALRLVLRFRGVIDVSRGEIYKTALALAPDCALRETYFKSISPWILRGRELTWPSTICSYYNQWLIAHSRNAPYLASGQWGAGKCKFLVRDSTKQTLINTLTIGDESKQDCGWLVISDDGRRVAAAPQVDEELWIWDVASGERSELYIPDIYRVMCMAFSPEGSQLFALVLPKDRAKGEPANMIRVWDTRTLSQVKAFQCNPDTVAFALSLDGRTLVTLAGKDFEVFDAESAKRRRVFGTGDHLSWRRRGFTSVIAFLPDNVKFAVTVPRESQATMEIYDSARGTLIYTLEGVQVDVGVSVSSTGLLACSKDGVRLIDTNVLPMVASSWTVPAKSVTSMTFKDDGTHIFIREENGLVRLIDVFEARRSSAARPALPDVDRDGEVYVSTPEADGSTYRVEWRVANHTLHVRSPSFYYDISLDGPGLCDKESVEDLIVSPNQEHVAFYFQKGYGIYPWVYDAQSRSCTPLQGNPRTAWDRGPDYHPRMRIRLDAMPTNDREDNKIRPDDPSLLRFTDDGQIVYMNSYTTMLKWNITDGKFESKEAIRETMIRTATFNKSSNRLLVIGKHQRGGWYKCVSYGNDRGPDGMHGEAHVSLFEYPSMKELPVYLQDASFGQFHPITGEPRFIIWNEWMELVTEHSRRRLLWIPPEWKDIYNGGRVASGRWDGSVLTVYLKSQTLIFDVDAIERDVYGS